MKKKNLENTGLRSRCAKLREAHQPYLLAPTAPYVAHRKVALKTDMPANATQERDKLETRYGEFLVEQPSYRRLVTYVPNKNIPLYNWFKYKEGFSRELVVNLIRKFGLPEGAVVYDPFVGCGTTALASIECGMDAVGTDILDVAVFTAQTKTCSLPSLDRFARAVKKLIEAPFKQPRKKMANIRIVGLAYSSALQEELMFFKEAIDAQPDDVRIFLMLGLLSVLEDVSSTSKDGQFLRLVEKPAKTVRDALRQTFAAMLSDMTLMESCEQKEPGRALIIKGDAREQCLPLRYHHNIDAVITSPPYLNRYDYSRSYALELCLLNVATHEDMVAVRHSLLRSHIESREHEGKQISLPALDELITQLQAKQLNNNRVPIMVRGYFEDMNQVIRNLAHYTKSGGNIALVVANAQFAGEHVPTDLLLCELARANGLVTQEIWVTRYKGNSSQQMAVYGRRPVRESIVFWRRP